MNYTTSDHKKHQLNQQKMTKVICYPMTKVITMRQNYSFIAARNELQGEESFTKKSRTSSGHNKNKKDFLLKI